MGSTATCPCVQHPSFTGSHCEMDINKCMQGQIQDFLGGGLNIEVIFEAARGSGGTGPQKLQGVLFGEYSFVVHIATDKLLYISTDKISCTYMFVTSKAFLSN